MLQRGRVAVRQPPALSGQSPVLCPQSPVPGCSSRVFRLRLSGFVSLFFRFEGARPPSRSNRIFNIRRGQPLDVGNRVNMAMIPPFLTRGRHWEACNEKGPDARVLLVQGSVSLCGRRHRQCKQDCGEKGTEVTRDCRSRRSCRLFAARELRRRCCRSGGSRVSESRPGPASRNENELKANDSSRSFGLRGYQTAIEDQGKVQPVFQFPLPLQVVEINVNVAAILSALHDNSSAACVL